MPVIKRIVVCRHFETEKNLLDIHGSSALGNLTIRGYSQANFLAQRFRARRWRPKAVSYAPTIQAENSARILAELLDVPIGDKLSLSPFNLGIASGISTDELRHRDENSFKSLELFRARLVDARALKIKDAEDVLLLEHRLINWWEKEGSQQCPDKIIVASSSTALMISNFLDGILPTSGKYYYLAMPNGSMREWSQCGKNGNWTSENAVPQRSWPQTDQREMVSDCGSIATSFFLPSWDPRSTAVVVTPGYFGNSRHGPYGLYTLIARRCSYLGFLTATIDPLGSGESSPIYRTFESEVASATFVTAEVLRSHRQVIIFGHSIGAATALAAAAHFPERAKAWCLAPLCTFCEMEAAFFDETQLNELAVSGTTTRHGIRIDKKLIDMCSEAWRKLSCKAANIFLADNDAYTKNQDLSYLSGERIIRISDANHNFTLQSAKQNLLDHIEQQLAATEHYR